MANRTFILLFVFFLSLCARADKFSFRGVDQATMNAVLGEVKRSKKPTSFSRADEILRLLMKSGLYQNVSYEMDSETQVISFSAKPKILIKDFKILGADNLNLKKVSIPPELRPGRPYEKDRVLRYASRVKEYYAENGFLESKVELELSTADGQATVNLVITEGTQSQIGKIDFESQNVELVTALNKVARKFVGGAYTNGSIEKVKETVRAYLKQNRYIRTSILQPIIKSNSDRTKISIRIPLENDLAYHFKISMTKPNVLSETSLRRLISESSLSSESRPPVEFTEEFIRDLYLQKGFANIQIKVHQKTIKKGFRHEISIDIVEHERVEIGKLEIDGLISRPKSYYRDFILDQSSALVVRGYYNRGAIEKAAEALIAELRNQGYLKSKVQSVKINPIPKQHRVDIAIQINEGPLTQIRAIEFSGNRSFSNLELIEQTGLEVQSPLQLKNVEESLNKVSKFYLDKGYLEMKILNRNKKVVEYNSSNTEATVKYEIYEGPQFRVGSIYVQGNEQTQTKVILRELEFKEGDILTPELVLTSKQRLERLGFFNSVTIDTIEKNTTISNRSVVIQVSENEPQTFSAGLGVTNERDITIRGSLSYNWENILGSGRGVSLRAEGNRDFDSDISFTEHALTFGYFEPYLYQPWFGNTHLRTVAVWSRDIFDIEGSDVTILEKIDINLLFENQLTERFKIIFGLPRWSIQKDYLKDNADDSTTVTVIKTGPTFEWDGRDDRFNPKSGFFARLTTEYAPIEPVRFAKATTRLSYYLPFFGKKLIFANSLSGGYLKNFGADGVPAVEAFFLGGQSTIRGFQSFTEHIPQGEQLGLATTDSISDFEVNKDSYFGLFKTEVRFPIYDILGGAVFYDGGLVQVTGFDFDDPYRDSIGFGLHVVTPVGPVNFEFGFKLDRNQELNEDPWQFHFSIGSF